MTSRTSAGRFRAEQPRDSRFLLEIVADVARKAVENDATRTPLSVTHREFKTAALDPELVARYGRITTPNAICAQLPDKQGMPIRWHRLLALALNDDRTALSIRREHESLHKADEDPQLSDDHIHFALNYVVRAERAWAGRDIPFLRGAIYDEARSRLIAQDRTRTRPYALAARLPTRPQIERAAGGWHRALELAELPLPDSTTPAGRRGVELVEAGLRYYVESEGYLPSYGQTLDFASRFRFSLQRFEGRWEQDVVAAAIGEIARRHLGEPHPYEPRLNPDVSPPEGYEPDPDDPVYVEKQYWENKPLVLQFVIEFLGWLGSEPSAEPRWERFRAEKALWGIPLPNADTLRNRHGGLAALVREASLPGALERAIAEYEREPTPEELAERARRQLVRQAAKPQAQELLAFIRERGEIGPKAISDERRWSRTKVVFWCSILRDQRMISATHENPNHSDVRYFAVTDGQTEETLREIRAQREIELRASRAASAPLLQLLHERGALPPTTIMSELGWTRGKLHHVLDAVTPARLVAATHDGTTRSVHYFAITPEMVEEEIEALRQEIEQRVEWDTPQGRALLALLREHMALTPKEIRALLRWDSAKVEYWLPRLVRHGFVARTHQNPKSRYGRYIALAPDVTEEQITALRAYWNKQPHRDTGEPRLLHIYLLERHEPVAPKEIRERNALAGPVRRRPSSSSCSSVPGSQNAPVVGRTTPAGSARPTTRRRAAGSATARSNRRRSCGRPPR